MDREIRIKISQDMDITEGQAVAIALKAAQDYLGKDPGPRTVKVFVEDTLRVEIVITGE